MTSHTYDFAPRDLARVLGWPLVPVAVFALLMHAGVSLHLLPLPRPTFDVDRTILVHQLEACRATNDADVLLVGDSSCLMDVDARQLGAQLNRPVLNLGTLSYLDPNAWATLVREYVAANPGRLRAVVLLAHPEALRRTGAEVWHLDFMDRQLNGEDFVPMNGPLDWASDALGLEIFRGRVYSRILASALPGAYGRFYGFSDGLERYLIAHDGSAVDPDARPLSGNAEYRLSAQLEAPSRNFRAAVPPGARLLAGLTPAPAKFAGTRYPETRDALLGQWNQWLQADATLKDLPATMPDERFARTTHLNETGARAFTDALAQCLRRPLATER
jgi:hypothetical protein